MLFRSDRKSTRLNSSHTIISYAVFCLKKKNVQKLRAGTQQLRHEQHRSAQLSPRHPPLRPPAPALIASGLFRPFLTVDLFFFKCSGAPRVFHPPLPPPLPV